MIQPTALGKDAAPALRTPGRSAWLLGILALALVTWPAPGRAYTLAGVLTDGCHEAITTRALREVRAQADPRYAGADPAGLSGSDGAMVRDLPFVLASDMKDIGAATLL